MKFTFWAIENADYITGHITLTWTVCFTDVNILSDLIPNTQIDHNGLFTSMFGHATDGFQYFFFSGKWKFLFINRITSLQQLIYIRLINAIIMNM